MDAFRAASLGSDTGTSFDSIRSTVTGSKRYSTSHRYLPRGHTSPSDDESEGSSSQGIHHQPLDCQELERRTSTPDDAILAKLRIKTSPPSVSDKQSLPCRIMSLGTKELGRSKDSKRPRSANIEGLPSSNGQGKGKWAGIALQPGFSPISQEQLATEVEGIYAGLIMVEAKCINAHAAMGQSQNTEQSLSTEQWQALVALHRTLLYEHHDFLMATQHPSANSALTGLAQKYNMPARMWKHGIHGFLEILGHRRPDSQEYLLAFIYIAYQMISLLLETVPEFTDTWIECLRDLARYRMAIEEDREIHTIWGDVAGRWYARAHERDMKAAGGDHSPDVGRPHHHAGILEIPALRKVNPYARETTTIIPGSPRSDPKDIKPQPAHQRTTSSSSMTEPVIHGSLHNTNVEAFPDTGAAANFMSSRYVQNQGFEVDVSNKGHVKIGSGSRIRIMGTVTLPFSFTGESEKHSLVFNVLRKSVHDVVLGSRFLRMTETFTRFAHRVGRRVRKAFEHSFHRMCLLGSQQFVSGLINGVSTEAIPDTGADVSVMSASFAKANGLHINREWQHQVMLGFADGSTATAIGLVENAAWNYGADGRTYYTDICVLEDLPVDLVLGYDFLCETCAFAEHENAFWHTEDREDDDAWTLSIIQLLEEAMKRPKNERLREYSDGSVS